MKISIKKNIYPMLKWAKDLFPLNRSITGQGLRDTLAYLKKINPSLKILSFRSGTRVFDWIIPSEWNVKEAYIKHESNKKFAEYKKNNLHLVSYSIPTKKTLTKKVLLKKIFTLKKQPNAIPYITSYYKKDWGFCMSEKEKNKLPRGKYKVVINTSFKKKGTMEIGEVIIRGKSKKEIFFSTYICHPSMVNNELSGPVVSSALIKFIKENYKKTYYSYRFVFVPETIGSITYISKKIRQLKQNVIAGFNLSCLGDSNSYSQIHTRYENTLADYSLESSLIGKRKVKFYSFLQRGSDERQYCSPGVDLPLVGFCRSKYGTYSEYHSSKDDFKIVSQKNLKDSLNVLIEIIRSFEIGIYPKSTTLCEPMLSKRNLYPTMYSKENKNFGRKYLDIHAYCDGKLNLFEIARKINLNLSKVNHLISILKKENIIKTRYKK